MTARWKPRLTTQLGPNGERDAQKTTPQTEPPRPMPRLIWQWLLSRGISSADQVSEFLTPSLSKMIHPRELKGMDKALERLVQAYKDQEKICVYGDYDLDGSTGIALLTDGLKGLGFKNVSFYQPSRFLEGYGIHTDALEIIAKRGDKVVISVDCGITAIDEAKKARELGLDLIITDHHLARKDEKGGEILPDALAVLNPNQKACVATLGHLSGVGVGFYLILGLKTALKEAAARGEFQSEVGTGTSTESQRSAPFDVFDPKSLLDLFTIGTITDMVPLKRENRVLVKHGLKLLGQTRRPGLQALVKHLGLWGRDLDSQDVAFTLAPKLNALSRLELGIRPLDVFMCDDPKRAEVLAEEVVALNEKRKTLQSELEEKIKSQLEGELEQPAIVLAAEGHAGVVGLVATKVTQLTSKPAFIVAWHDGEGVGSARGAEDDRLPDALAAATEFLERHGGHAQAAGFSLKRENFEKFKEAVLRHYVERERHDEEALAERLYDVDARVSDFNDNFMTWLKHAGPFGSENPAPLFKISDPAVLGVQWLKGQHLKLILNDEGVRMEALAFFAQNQYQVETGQKIELLVEPGWNYYRGERRIQLMIRDLRALPDRTDSATAAISDPDHLAAAPNSTPAR